LTKRIRMGRLHCVAQCLTAIVLLTVSVTALAQPQTNSLIETSQYLEDPSGDFSPETLGERAFTEFEGMLARGYTPSTYWIKLAVSDSAKSQEQLVLRIRPTYLDDIQLYLPDPNDSGRLKLIDRSGDLHPWSEDEYRSLISIFCSVVSSWPIRSICAYPPAAPCLSTRSS